jgi:hypothetical protein
MNLKAENIEWVECKDKIKRPIVLTPSLNARFADDVLTWSNNCGHITQLKITGIKEDDKQTMLGLIRKGEFTLVVE